MKLINWGSKGIFLLTDIHLTKEDSVGSCKWKGRLDLFNIIMIGLAGTLPEHNEMYELHQFAWNIIIVGTYGG